MCCVAMDEKIKIGKPLNGRSYFRLFYVITKRQCRVTRVQLFVLDKNVCTTVIMCLAIVWEKTVGLSAEQFKGLKDIIVFFLELRICLIMEILIIS